MLWGYGSERELVDAGAAVIVPVVADLVGSVDRAMADRRIPRGAEAPK